MQAKIINFFAFLAAMSLAVCSAYFSVLGLQSIFAAAYWPIIAMGGILEVSKLIAASWLYRYWSVTPFLIKTYLVVAVAILMGITSMGVYGFLSKAHIEQGVDNSIQVAEQVTSLDEKIKYQQSVIDGIAAEIDNIDKTSSAAVSRGKTVADTQRALNISKSQAKARAEEENKREQEGQKLVELKSQRAVLESKVKRLDAEVGPIKYLNALFTNDNSPDALERAVRWVTVMIVMVFDPLAVILLIAANLGVYKSKMLALMGSGKAIIIPKTNVHYAGEVWAPRERESPPSQDLPASSKAESGGGATLPI